MEDFSFDTTFLNISESARTKLSSVASRHILCVSLMRLHAWLIPDLMLAVFSLK